jgi:hypothetical protein
MRYVDDDWRPSPLWEVEENGTNCAIGIVHGTEYISDGHEAEQVLKDAEEQGLAYLVFNFNRRDLKTKQQKNLFGALTSYPGAASIHASRGGKSFVKAVMVPIIPVL